MKKRILIFLVIFSASANSQDLDSLMMKRALSCADIAYNSALLFQEYYAGNKMIQQK
jgi:hypothetical protein